MNQNRFSSLWITSIALTLILAGCSSVKTRVDNAPVNARTFSFLDPGSRRPPIDAEASGQIHAMIQQAIINNLAAKGISHVATGGDVTVAYLVVAGNNVATTSLDTYFGYSEDSSAWAERIHKEQTGSDSPRGYFEAGTLVIDFINRNTSTLLQRRSIQAEVLRNLSIEQRAERLQRIVDQALSDVRPSR